LSSFISGGRDLQQSCWSVKGEGWWRMGGDLKILPELFVSKKEFCEVVSKYQG